MSEQNKKDQHYYIPTGSPVAPDVYDTRVRLKFLSRGVLTPQGLAKHLQELPDDSASAEFRSIETVLGLDSGSDQDNGGIN